MDLISSPEFEKNPPATETAIRAVEDSLELQFPPDYRACMRRFNGGEGFLSETFYLMLWQLEELEDFNRDYEVAEYCEGLLLFGSNGGGEAFGFDTRSRPWHVVQVPFVGMDESLIETLGKSFTEFLKQGSAGDGS